jgi:hypothetical protein
MIPVYAIFKHIVNALGLSATMANVTVAKFDLQVLPTLAALTNAQNSEWKESLFQLQDYVQKELDSPRLPKSQEITRCDLPTVSDLIDDHKIRWMISLLHGSGAEIPRMSILPMKKEMGLSTSKARVVLGILGGAGLLAVTMNFFPTLLVVVIVAVSAVATIIQEQRSRPKRYYISRQVFNDNLHHRLVSLRDRFSYDPWEEALAFGTEGVRVIGPIAFEKTLLSLPSISFQLVARVILDTRCK